MPTFGYQTDNLAFAPLADGKLTDLHTTEIPSHYYSNSRIYLYTVENVHIFIQT